MNSIYGSLAATAAVLILWLLLSAAMTLADIATGLLVAAAVGAWVPLGDI